MYAPAAIDFPTDCVGTWCSHSIGTPRIARLETRRVRKMTAVALKRSCKQKSSPFFRIGLARTSKPIYEKNAQSYGKNNGTEVNDRFNVAHSRLPAPLLVCTGFRSRIAA